jgi:hypothetical protein
MEGASRLSTNQLTDVQTFGAFLLQEGFRQDALMWDMATQLGTKNGLFMVFAAFIFTAESTLAGISGTIGVKIPQLGLVIALFLALIGIGILLRCAFLEKYKMPPALPELREQAARFFDLVDIKRFSEEERMTQFQGKFINSLSRSVSANFEVNKRIAKNLECASWLIAGSVSCLLLGLLWSVGEPAITFLSRLNLGCV